MKIIYFKASLPSYLIKHVAVTFELNRNLQIFITFHLLKRIKSTASLPASFAAGSSDSAAAVALRRSREPHKFQYFSKTTHGFNKLINDSRF